jgi:hypothetical protein
MTSTTKPTPRRHHNEETSMSQSPGFTHLALTVTDLCRSPALDHVAFNCACRTELEKWGCRLDELGFFAPPS